MYKRFLLAIFLMFMVIGCDNKTTIEPTTLTTSITYHDITLENEYNDLTRDFDDLAYGEVLILPVDQIEGKVFVGWSDGENIYNNNLTVQTSLSLQAVYEEVSAVFEYNSSPLTNEITITAYLGEAKYLRIPSRIDDYIVRGIATNAFDGSPIIEIELPSSIQRIYPKAFIDLLDLQKVSFYEGFAENVETVMSKTEYDMIIESYSEQCQITETTESGWKLSQGCPIIEVLNISEINVPGVGSYYNYTVLADSSTISAGLTYMMIDSEAFTNLPELTTFAFPSNLEMFIPDMFNNTPKLNNLSFPETSRYFVEENIVYRFSTNNQNPDQSVVNLVYYPQGLTDKEFTVPEQVSIIGSAAFAGNKYLEVVNMSANVTNIGFRAFTYVENLQEINLEENDSDFYTIDGVLYYRDVLATYPMAKEEKSFTVPEDISLIAALAFYGQKHLESINLNNGLISIGQSSFAKVEKLKMLNIPSSVESIDQYFTKESSIEIVIINRSVVLNGSLTFIRASLDSSTPQFYVPDDSYDDYISDFNWGVLADYILSLSELEIEG